MFIIAKAKGSVKGMIRENKINLTKNKNMLKEKINEFYLSNQKDRTQNRFFISDAGKCHRQIFYSFKNAPKKPIEPNFLRLFDLGNHVHQMIMRSLLNIKGIRVVAAEINIPPHGIISGRADAILSVDKEFYVLDIKSMNSRAFGYLNEAKEDNVLQLRLYLYYFKINKGILLYMNKDDLRLKEFIVDSDTKQVEKLLGELNVLREQIDSNTLPSRLSDYPKNWRCRYCNFSSACKAIHK